jgi:hypothetical protein
MGGKKVKHRDSFVSAHLSVLNDHLTILLNVAEQLERAGTVPDFMVVDIRTAVHGCVLGVAGIQEAARHA